jgi:putative ABC transport system permease protein
MITELLTRLRFLVPRKGRGELELELQFHIEQSIAFKSATGLSAQEARRQALIEFGGIELTREQCERQRPGWWMGTVLQDVRYAMRGFRRGPVFTMSVLLTLALGIGATTAVFSVVDRILFRPLPYADPSQIVSVGLVHSLERQEFLMGPFYLEWRENRTPFSALAIQSTNIHNCDLVEQNPAQLSCIAFDAGFLPLFGISPVLGRNFLREEDRPNGPPVVMISYGLWKGHYSGDPHILERTINVDGSSRRVVGVLPSEFQFPTLETAEIIFPMALNPAIQQTTNMGFGTAMRAFARLKPGVSVAQAHAEMQPLFESEMHLFPAEARKEVSKEVRLSIRSLRDRETQDAQPVAWVLLGFVLAVLLIACANVASLMMARGAARQREIALRAAIGASRGRLIRQALTEALLLSCAGGAVGLVTARGLLAVFVGLAPTGIPFIGKAHLDMHIAVFAALLSCLCGVIFGCASAVEKPGLETLNAKASLSRSYAFLRRSLVTAQIAVTIVLLSGAALLLRSFVKIEEQNLGMQTDGVLTVKAALPGPHYDTNQKAMEFYLQLEAALRRLPGTRAVGIADSVPPGGWQGDFRYSDLVVQGKPRTAPGSGGTVLGRTVTPDYFRALNIPVVRGRDFTEEDRTGNDSEVILSRSLAARLFPDQDPIGKRIGTRVRSDAGTTVVGVADNVKNNGLTEESDPEIYYLRRSVGDDWGKKSIVVMDSVMPAKAVEPWVRSEIASIDPTVPVETEALDQTVSRLADRPRFETALLVFFAGTGLMLAIVGLYGLISFMTTQRRHEIGVRMAMGATRGNILGLITSDGLRMVAIGGALGVGSALAVSKVLKALLFEVSAYDPGTFFAVPALLTLVALVAILIPARAGMRVDPAVTLRAE